MLAQPFNMTMNDGSRHFYSHPIVIGWYKLLRHLRKLPTYKLTNILSDHVTEAWIDFLYKGYEFEINDQFGDYWFFVKDPNCPEAILQEIVEHCGKLSVEKTK